MVCSKKQRKWRDIFFETLPTASGPARDTSLSHLPELIRVLTGMNTLDFVRKVVVQLCKQLSESGTQNDPGHVHIANALATAAHSMGMFEDFDTALRIGLELDRNQQRDSAAHQSCCAVGLENLLAPATIQKLIELAIQKTRDPAASRTIASLLRLIENQAAEMVFQMLEDERVAANRSKLLHISRQLGAGSFEAARKRLNDERWYVVRNACYVLGSLSDPDVVSHLMPAFSHSDPRVQEAAVSALVKGNLPNRGAALAAALPNLSQHLQESVLNELIIVKDASAIGPLTEFLKNASGGRLPIIEKAAQALSALSDDSATDALASLAGGVLSNPAFKRTLLSAMRNSPHEATRKKAESLS